MLLIFIPIFIALFVMAYEIDRLRQRVSKLEQQGEIRCNYTDKEIAQSFIEDVKMGEIRRNQMKKYETIEIKVTGGKKKEFTSCADCKYWNIPETCCKAMGCIHAFDRMCDCFEKENTGD